MGSTLYLWAYFTMTFWYRVPRSNQIKRRTSTRTVIKKRIASKKVMHERSESLNITYSKFWNHSCLFFCVTIVQIIHRWNPWLAMAALRDGKLSKTGFKRGSLRALAHQVFQLFNRERQPLQTEWDGILWYPPTDSRSTEPVSCF